MNDDLYDFLIEQNELDEKVMTKIVEKLIKKREKELNENILDYAAGGEYAASNGVIATRLGAAALIGVAAYKVYKYYQKSTLIKKTEKYLGTGIANKVEKAYELSKSKVPSKKKNALKYIAGIAAKIKAKEK